MIRVLKAGVLSCRNPRARRLSGDSDSSSSSSRHSASLGRKRSEEASLALRKEAGRRGSEGPASLLHAGPKRPSASRSQSRDRLSLPKTVAAVPRRIESEERGRPRLTSRPSKPGLQNPRPRARSQGRPGGEPVLLISRAKDGQHSWTRADEPKENTGGSGRATPRTKSPARGYLTPVGSRSPAPTKRRGSLPATKTANPSIRMPPPAPGRQQQHCLARQRGTVRQPRSEESGPSGQPDDTLGQELEVTAQAFRTPLRLDPSQEQQLYKRLEEEFLANSQMMGLEMDEELDPGSQACNGARLLPANPDQGTADSAYCSSSSSSSSLNVFSKYGLQPEESKRKAAHQMTGVSELVDFHNGSADASELWDSSGSRERRSCWRKPVLSSSSDESNCYLGLNDVQEVQEGLELAEPLADSPWAAGEPVPSHTELGPSLQDGLEALGTSPSAPVLEEVVLRPQSSLRKPDRVPSIYKLKLRSQIKPRADSQPDKTPSKIPTPLSYKASGAQKAPTESTSSKDSPARGLSERRGWAAFHNLFSSSFGEGPGSSVVESGVADEGAWA